jgi:dynein heavy chain
MKEFKNSTTVLESLDAKKHIRNYNKLARALIEFEVLWYRSWYNVVDQAKTGLQATLLVSTPEGQVYVNFDPQIFQLIKETKCMLRMGLEVPESIKNICMKELYYKNLNVELNNILRTKKSLMEKVNPMALAPHFDELDKNLQPGLTALSWKSLNIDDFLQNNFKHLAKLQELVDKVLDIAHCRFENGVREIAELTLIEIPGEHEQWTIESFQVKT